MDKKVFALGVIGGTTADLFWRNIPGFSFFINSETQNSETQKRNTLAFIDHTHWGLLATLAANYTEHKDILRGFGIGLITTKFTYPHNPIKEEEWQTGASISLISILFGLNLLVFKRR